MSTAVKRYSGGAIILHWLIALMLAGEIGLGFSMPRDPSGFELFQLHKSIGITILLLSLFRLGWRFSHKRPEKLEGGVNGFLASAVHLGFYFVMIVIPLTGWAVVSTSDFDIPTLLFGVVPWPHLPLSNGLNELFEEAHELLAFLAIGLFILHIAGALRHHFLMHDGLLARMAPHGSPSMALALLGAVVGLGGAVFFGIAKGGDEKGAAPVDERVPMAADASANLGDSVDGEALADEDDAAENDEDAAEGIEEEGESDEAEEEAAAQEVDASAESGPPPSWAIQSGGKLGFAVDNAGYALSGSFSNWSGDIVMDPDNPESAELSISVDLASASLGDATQDNMLQGDEFFATSANPRATWRSTNVRSLGGNNYEADGTLSLRGVSSSQSVRFTLSGSGNTRSVAGAASIARKAFSVGNGSNSSGVADNVALTFAFDARK